MAAGISVINGVEEAAYSGGKLPWHSMGTTVKHVMNSEEAINLAHMNWTVSKRTFTGEGGIDCGDFRMVVRDDIGVILGVVSKNYAMVQNHEAFSCIDSLLQDGSIGIESCGTLWGGEQFWVLGRMPTVDFVTEDDAQERFVLFSSSHTGLKKLHANITSVRVVCQNTLSLATAGMEGIRHSGIMSKKLEMARQYVSQFDEGFTLFRDKARLLTKTKMTQDDISAYLEKLFPTPTNVKSQNATTIRNKKVSAIRANFRNSKNAMPSIRNSVWAAYNSVSEWVDHSSTFKGEGRQYDENRFAALTEGHSAALKNKAFDLACDWAGVS